MAPENLAILIMGGVFTGLILISLLVFWISGKIRRRKEQRRYAEWKARVAAINVANRKEDENIRRESVRKAVVAPTSAIRVSKYDRGRRSADLVVGSDCGVDVCDCGGDCGGDCSPADCAPADCSRDCSSDCSHDCSNDCSSDCSGGDC